MKMRFNKIIVCLLFLILIFGICFSTVRSSWNGLKEVIVQKDQLGTTMVNNLESVLTNNLTYRNRFIEFYGISQKVLGRNLVGDNQFYQDKDNIMHLQRPYQSGAKIAESIEYLASEMSSRDVPFMVCQIAERAAYGNDLSRYTDGGSLAYLDNINQVLEGSDAIRLDYQECLARSNFSSEDIFFKTDVHYTTEAEFHILKEMINTLVSETEVVFDNKEIALNLENYAVEKYPFWGNLIDSTGKYYAGTDTFTYYIPNFETSMTLVNPSSNVNRSGTFEDVCMNGYRDQYDQNAKVYRVTDFMQWPSPYYYITNNLVPNNDVLVIGCSMSMRTSAYLSLLCHSVTVLDPRYFHETDYLAAALENQYDAVICFPSYNLLEGLSGYNAEILKYEVVPQENGTFTMYADVKNNGTTAWKYSDNIRMHLWLNDSDVGIRSELSPDKAVEPEETYTFVLQNLPAALSSFDITAQMLIEGRFYFGEKETVSTGYAGDAMLMDAEIVSHTTPASVEADEPVSFEVIVKNTGISAWTSSSQIRLCLWRDGADYGFRIHLPSGITVEPQQEYTFVMNGMTLSKGEKVNFDYQMVQEGVAYFGESEPVFVTAS